MLYLTQFSCHMPLKVQGLDKVLWYGLPNVAVVYVLIWCCGVVQKQRGLPFINIKSFIIQCNSRSIFVTVTVSGKFNHSIAERKFFQISRDTSYTILHGSAIFQFLNPCTKGNFERYVEHINQNVIMLIIFFSYLPVGENRKIARRCRSASGVHVYQPQHN